jgi:transposase
MRQRNKRPLIDLPKKAIDHLLEINVSPLPKSPLGQVLRYAQGHWPSMQVYLEHGEVEIDNNLVENAIGPSAVGKKNQPFIGHPEAGELSAIIYTPLISAEAQGVAPQTYLTDVIKRIPGADPNDLDQLTPANWANDFKAQQQQELQRTA